MKNTAVMAGIVAVFDNRKCGLPQKTLVAVADISANCAKFE
jgi:hypothetical protein